VLTTGDSWLTTLGLLKAAGAAGLALGLAGVPLIGTAGALGLALFFVGAIVTHLRAHNHDIAFPRAYLALAVGSLVLSLAA
jgi:DoxX-like family